MYHHKFVNSFRGSELCQDLCQGRGWPDFGSVGTARPLDLRSSRGRPSSQGAAVPVTPTPPSPAEQDGFFSILCGPPFPRLPVWARTQGSTVELGQ